MNSLIHSGIHKYLPPASRLNSIFGKQLQLDFRVNSDDIPAVCETGANI
jgi:hypothetical protein